MERVQIPVPETAERVTLPAPAPGGETTVTAALGARRSLRDFAGAAIGLDEVARLLWAAQGITDPMGLRTAPSAGALYPLECHLVAGAVTGLAAAVYRYDPRRHDLSPTLAGDRRGELAAAAAPPSSAPSTTRACTGFWPWHPTRTRSRCCRSGGRNRIRPRAEARRTESAMKFCIVTVNNDEVVLEAEAVDNLAEFVHLAQKDGFINTMGDINHRLPLGFKLARFGQQRSWPYLLVVRS